MGKVFNLFVSTWKIAFDPARLARRILLKFNLGSFETRLKYDAFLYPNYAYGTYQAALQAKQLGLKSISVIEFGVAGGRGLLNLENISMEVGNLTGINIDVYGFDTSMGMPESSDYRDLPYIWQKGFFKMDFEILKKKLKKSKLIIGDVKDTINNFTKEYNPSPVGFISFDMDYYSSTMNSFLLFENEYKYFLPRVFCHFDDCIGDDWEIHSEFSGELLAINEFNFNNKSKKISLINGLKHKRFNPMPWNDEHYVLHLFEHPLYNQHILKTKNWQIPLNS